MILTEQQVNHYYPFGGLFGEGLQTANQPYKYNGKELDHVNGLDLYDYGARHYDAAIGRWGTPDPLMEKYYPFSSYVYVGNNPVNIVDPNGMDWYWDKNGNIIENYRNDGSIMYSNEASGYARIWNNSINVVVSLRSSNLNQGYNYINQNLTNKNPSITPQTIMQNQNPYSLRKLSLDRTSLIIKYLKSREQ